MANAKRIKLVRGNGKNQRVIFIDPSRVGTIKVLKNGGYIEEKIKPTKTKAKTNNRK